MTFWNERFEHAGPPVRKIRLLELTGDRTDYVRRAIMPWYGTILIASLLRAEGYDVEALVEGISDFDETDLEGADAILVCLWAGNLRLCAEMVDRVRQRARAAGRRPPPIIGGGALAKVAPSAVAAACDVLVRGEGEDTIVELLEAMNRGTDLRKVPGLTFATPRGLVHSPTRPFTRRLDVPTSMDVVRGYRRLGAIEQLRRGRFVFMTVETSRGCPFGCKFCITPDLYGSHRPRTVDTVLADLRDRLRYSRRVWFIDNLFVVKRELTVELLERMRREGLHEGGNYTCFLRVENARDEEMLGLLRRAGFANVYIGFEAIDEVNQREWNKVLKFEEMASSIETCHRHGLRVHGSFLSGSDTQHAEDIVKTVDWAMEHDLDYMSLYVISPVQMKDNLCIPRHRILAPSWDYVTGDYVTFFPRHMKPSVLALTVRNEMHRFYHPRRLPSRAARLRGVDNLGKWLAATLAIRATVAEVDRGIAPYLEYLKRIEVPYYDASGQLLEGLLPPEGVTRLPYLDDVDPPVRIIGGGKERQAVQRESDGARFTAEHCAASS